MQSDKLDIIAILCACAPVPAEILRKNHLFLHVIISKEDSIWPVILCPIKTNWQ